MKKHFRIGILFAVVFFIVGVITVKEYSINWDEPIHFFRGQDILHFYLTGKKDFSDFNANPPIRRSLYQANSISYSFLEKQFNQSNKLLTQGGNLPLGIGHPPFSGVTASFFNYVFYQKLGWVGDIDSYHWYSIFLASLLVGYMFYFVSKRFGIFAGSISAIALSLYPLFLGESRYNTKDIPEAVYYSFTILFFYNSIVSNTLKKSIGWIILSSIFFSFGFATKFNIIFFPAIILPWVLTLWIKKFRTSPLKFIKEKYPLLLSFLLYPIVGLSVFYASWPIFWQNPLKGLLMVVDYYKWIGINPNFDQRFITFFHLNTYAVQWIVNTTPFVILFLTLCGFIYVIKNFLKEKDKISILVLWWFIFPLLRVTMPNAGIYGGVRQIMEYIPAMAILCGLGALWLVKVVSKKNLLQILIFASFLPLLIKLISLHPNESLFFNSLNGGLKGAMERDVPGWGNSLGSTYRQGTAWVNNNVEKNAKLSLVFGLLANIPQTDLRPDLEINTRYRSGLKREGEYAIDLVHSQTRENLYYRKYVERFLNPVWELNVDGVVVLKIWKNDIEHTKPEYQKDEIVISPKGIENEEKMMTVDLGGAKRITKIQVNYDPSSCTLPAQGHFMISKDKDNWERMTDDFTAFYFAPWFRPQPEIGVLQFLFAAENARYIRLIINDESSCLLIHPVSIAVWHI